MDTEKCNTPYLLLSSFEGVSVPYQYIITLLDSHLTSDKCTRNEQKVEQFPAVLCSKISNSFHKLSNATKNYLVNVCGSSATNNSAFYLRF